MSLGLQHRVALVTGAASGIGRATATLLAQEGAALIVADIESSTAEDVAREIVSGGGKAQAVALDVADEAAWQQAIRQVLSNHRRLDVLVNNAGISSGKSVSETSLDEWQRVLAVNLDGVFLGMKCAIEAMSGDGGSIINVASVSGLKPSPGAAAYCASKAAVRMLSKVAAIECADANTNIRINVVTPGGVKTPMWDEMDFFRGLVDEHGGTEEAFAAMAGATPSHQFFSPEEIARTILYLASDESSHLSGVELVIDRGHSG